MEDFLTKINFAKKNNYINKLEQDNQKNKEKIERYVSNFKKEITEQEIEKRKCMQTIKELSENNQKLQQENNGYKYILSRIPNFIIRLFAGKKNIGGYLNG